MKKDNKEAIKKLVDRLKNHSLVGSWITEHYEKVTLEQRKGLAKELIDEFNKYLSNKDFPIKEGKSSQELCLNIINGIYSEREELLKQALGSDNVKSELEYISNEYNRLRLNFEHKVIDKITESLEGKYLQQENNLITNIKESNPKHKDYITEKLTRKLTEEKNKPLNKDSNTKPIALDEINIIIADKEAVAPAEVKVASGEAAAVEAVEEAAVEASPAGEAAPPPAAGEAAPPPPAARGEEVKEKYNEVPKELTNNKVEKKSPIKSVTISATDFDVPHYSPDNKLNSLPATAKDTAPLDRTNRNSTTAEGLYAQYKEQRNNSHATDKFNLFIDDDNLTISEVKVEDKPQIKTASLTDTEKNDASFIQAKVHNDRNIIEFSYNDTQKLGDTLSKCHIESAKEALNKFHTKDSKDSDKKEVPQQCTINLISDYKDGNLPDDVKAEINDMIKKVKECYGEQAPTFIIKSGGNKLDLNLESLSNKGESLSNKGESANEVTKDRSTPAAAEEERPKNRSGHNENNSTSPVTNSATSTPNPKPPLPLVTITGIKK